MKPFQRLDTSYTYDRSLLSPGKDVTCENEVI